MSSDTPAKTQTSSVFVQKNSQNIYFYPLEKLILERNNSTISPEKLISLEDIIKTKHEVSSASIYQDLLVLTDKDPDTSTGNLYLIDLSDSFLSTSLPFDDPFSSLNISESGDLTYTLDEKIFLDNLDFSQLIFSYLGSRYGFNFTIPRNIDSYTIAKKGIPIHYTIDSINISTFTSIDIEIFTDSYNLYYSNKKTENGSSTNRWTKLNLPFEKVDAMFCYQDNIYFIASPDSVYSPAKIPRDTSWISGSDYSKVAVVYSKDYEQTPLYYQEQRNIPDKNMICIQDFDTFLDSFNKRWFSYDDFLIYREQIQSQLDQREIRDQIKYIVLMEGTPELILPKEQIDNDFIIDGEWYSSEAAAIEPLLCLSKKDYDNRLVRNFFIMNPVYELSEQEMTLDNLDIYLVVRLEEFTPEDGKNLIDSYTFATDHSKGKFILDIGGSHFPELNLEYLKDSFSLLDNSNIPSEQIFIDKTSNLIKDKYNVLFNVSNGTHETTWNRYRHPNNGFIPGKAFAVIVESFNGRPICDEPPINWEPQGGHSFDSLSYPKTDNPLVYSNAQTLSKDLARRGLSYFAMRTEGGIYSFPDPDKIIQYAYFDGREFGEAAFASLQYLRTVTIYTDPLFKCKIDDD